MLIGQFLTYTILYNITRDKLYGGIAMKNIIILFFISIMMIISGLFIREWEIKSMSLTHNTWESFYLAKDNARRKVEGNINPISYIKNIGFIGTDDQLVSFLDSYHKNNRKKYTQEIVLDYETLNNIAKEYGLRLNKDKFSKANDYEKSYQIFNYMSAVETIKGDKEWNEYYPTIEFYDRDKLNIEYIYKKLNGFKHKALTNMIGMENTIDNRIIEYYNSTIEDGKSKDEKEARVFLEERLKTVREIEQDLNCKGEGMPQEFDLIVATYYEMAQLNGTYAINANEWKKFFSKIPYENRFTILPEEIYYMFTENYIGE